VRRVIILLLFVLGWAATGRADVILFKSGDRLTGKLVKLEKGKLIFEADELGSVTLDITRIQNFNTDASVELHLTDGTVIKSKVLPAEPGQFTIEKTRLLQVQSFALADLAAINPAGEPLLKWTGSLTIGLSSTHGNTFAESANVSSAAKRRSQKDRTGIYSSYLASRSRDPDNNKKKTTEESFVIGGKYDYFFTKKFYGYINGRLKKDHIADLDYRIIAGLGAGYQWVETEDMSFNTDAGFAQICEQFTSRDPDSGITETTGTDEASIQLGYSLDWKIAEKFTFLHQLTYYPSFSGLSDYFLTGSAELRAFITESLFSNFKVVLDYDSTPADGVDTTDIKYILGVGWNF